MMKRFKNWKAICKIDDGRLRLALALLDIDDTDIGRRIVAQLPEFFTEEEPGPYPLSLIRSSGDANDRSIGADCPVAFDGVPEWIPVTTFNRPDHTRGYDHPALPTEISPEAEQGEIVTWEGKQYVVLENNSEHCQLHISPAELIAVDL